MKPGHWHSCPSSILIKQRREREMKNDWGETTCMDFISNMIKSFPYQKSSQEESQHTLLTCWCCCLPTLCVSLKTQIIFTTHSFNNLSPIPKSFIRYRHQRDRTDRKSWSSHLISWTFIIMLHLKSFAPTVIIIPQPLHASFHYHFLSWSTQNKQRIVIVIIPSCHFASSLHHPHPHHQSLRQDKRAKP